MDEQGLKSGKEQGEEKQGRAKKAWPSRKASANGQLDRVVEQDGGTRHQGSTAGSHPGKGKEQEQGGQTAQHSNSWGRGGAGTVFSPVLELERRG